MDPNEFTEKLDRGDFNRLTDAQLAVIRGPRADQLNDVQLRVVRSRLAALRPAVAQPAAAPPQAPVVPHVQQAQTPAQLRWNKVTEAAGHMVLASENEKYLRKGWLKYFWGEAVGRAGAPGRLESLGAYGQQYKANALDAQARLFEIYEKLFPQDNVAASFDNLDTAWNGRDTEFREILAELLKIGCRGLPLTARPEGNDGRPSNMISYLRDAESLDVRVGWRSESRSWLEVRRSSGTKRQVDVDVLAEPMGMNEDWHPFSLPAYRNCLWFRGGENDNCLYSVVSAGYDFKTVTAFPLIVEYNWPKGGNGLAKPLEQWHAEEVQAHRNNLALVRLSDGSPQVMVATKIWVYLFLLKGLVLDTQALQTFHHAQGFPECGVTGVGIHDIYGYFEVVRVHHGLQREDGHTVFILNHAHAFPAEDRAQKYGGAQPQLEAAYKGVPAAPFATAWSETGSTPNVKHVRKGGFDRTIVNLIEFPTNSGLD